MEKPEVQWGNLLVQSAMKTPGMLDRLKSEPEIALKELVADAAKQAPRVMEQDRFIYRAVILTLSSISIAVVGCAIVLAIRGENNAVIQFPDILTALGSAAIGALAGILAPSPRTG